MGNVVERLMDIVAARQNNRILRLSFPTGGRVMTLDLQPATAAGDQTVPADRSACHIKGVLFEHGKNGNGYENQGSYADPQVLASLLFSVVQIAKTAKWDRK